MNGVAVMPFIMQFMFEGLFNRAKKLNKSMNSRRNTPKYIGDQKVKSLYKEFYRLRILFSYNVSTIAGKRDTDSPWRNDCLRVH